MDKFGKGVAMGILLNLGRRSSPCQKLWWISHLHFPLWTPISWGPFDRFKWFRKVITSPLFGKKNQRVRVITESRKNFMLSSFGAGIIWLEKKGDSLIGDSAALHGVQFSTPDASHHSSPRLNNCFALHNQPPACLGINKGARKETLRSSPWNTGCE